MNFILSNRSIVISLLISFVAFVSSENHGKHLREQIETNYRDLRSCKSPCYEFDDNDELEDAVRDYLSNKGKALEEYGHINCWNVGKFYKGRAMNVP